MGTDNYCDCNQAVTSDLIRFFIASPSGYVTIESYPELIYEHDGVFMDFAFISFWLGNEEVVFGCIDSAYMEYNAAANIDDSTLQQ